MGAGDKLTITAQSGNLGDAFEEIEVARNQDEAPSRSPSTPSTSSTSSASSTAPGSLWN
jgi:hypothetical protein